MNRKRQNNEGLQRTAQKGLFGLLHVLKEFAQKQIELERLARVAVLLLKSGASKNNSIFREIGESCLSQQRSDGGWTCVEDSVWSVALLAHFSEFSKEYRHGLNWLREQQLENGGWGKTNRDMGRIPITGTVLHLLPELSTKKSLEWLNSEWRKDFSLNYKLTYKGGFFLMASRILENELIDINLVHGTLSWLESQQNEDFGWGPSRGHPVGSTPFCTGLALTGLLQYPDIISRDVIATGLEWLQKNQLEDGLWPDHYIEEGSAWSFYALTEGYKFLKGR